MPVSGEAEAAPPGKLRSVVTYLEMTEPPNGEAPAAPAGATVERLDEVPVPVYRDLYRRVGEPWLWWERLTITDDALADVLNDPAVEVYLFRNGGVLIGYCELDRRETDAVEIAFFGLVPEAIGKGLGREVFGRVVDLAWRSAPRRVWLHTCTEDHPKALRFYIAAGFRPYRRETVIIDDPRAIGLLPPHAAPHLPAVRQHVSTSTG